jgi:hypothetical protein
MRQCYNFWVRTAAGMANDDSAWPTSEVGEAEADQRQRPADHGRERAIRISRPRPESYRHALRREVIDDTSANWLGRGRDLLIENMPSERYDRAYRSSQRGGPWDIPYNHDHYSRK